MDGLEVLQEISQTLLALLGEQQRISRELEENNYLMRENVRTTSALIRELREQRMGAAVTSYPYPIYNPPYNPSPYNTDGTAKWESPNEVKITYADTLKTLPGYTGLSGVLCENSNVK